MASSLLLIVLIHNLLEVIHNLFKLYTTFSYRIEVANLITKQDVTVQN